MQFLTKRLLRAGLGGNFRQMRGSPQPVCPWCCCHRGCGSFGAFVNLDGGAIRKGKEEGQNEEVDIVRFCSRLRLLVSSQGVAGLILMLAQHTHCANFENGGGGDD